MTWFETLTGFRETSSDSVRASMKLDGTKLTSLANNRTVDAGLFSTPTLSQLRNTIEIPKGQERRIRVSEVYNSTIIFDEGG